MFTSNRAYKRRQWRRFIRKPTRWPKLLRIQAIFTMGKLSDKNRILPIIYKRPVNDQAVAKPNPNYVSSPMRISGFEIPL